MGERCNGEDDDCDGAIDEGELCPGTTVCAGGSCVDACQTGNECFNSDEVLVSMADVWMPAWSCNVLWIWMLHVWMPVPRSSAPWAKSALKAIVSTTPATQRVASNDDICLDGLCQANPCAGVDCPDGAYCRIEGDPPAAR